MLTLRELASVAAIADPVIRRLIEQRFAELSQAGEFDSARMGYFVLIEPGDVGERIEAETGCPILSDCFGETRYGDADFSPGFEWLLEHASCYEMAFVFNDDGYSIGVFIPKLDIDPTLLALCAEYATPAIAPADGLETASPV